MVFVFEWRNYFANEECGCKRCIQTDDYLAEARVFAFDHLLVVDLEAVATEHTTEIVVGVAQDTDIIYRAMDTSVQIAGHGYQVQLLPAKHVGFREGDDAPCLSAARDASELIVLSDDHQSNDDPL